MYKIFECSSSLNAFMQSEKECALTQLCEQLSCDRSSVAFIFEGSDVDLEALKIPRS